MGGVSPGRTFRKSLFHAVSLMSAWCRPGLKEMGLNAPSRGRACWSSALGAKVHSDGGAAYRAPQPFTQTQVQPAKPQLRRPCTEDAHRVPAPL